MNTKQKVGCLTSVLSILVTTPIWLYLIYSILKFVGATDVMWLLYWIYVPAIFVVSFIKVVTDSIFEQ